MGRRWKCPSVTPGAQGLEGTVLVGSAKDGLLFFYLFILVMLCNLQELSSLIRD